MGVSFEYFRESNQVVSVCFEYFGENKLYYDMTLLYYSCPHSLISWMLNAVDSIM